MAKNRIRNKGVLVYFTEEELNLIDAEMQNAGYSKRSSYIRDHVIKGYVIKVDSSGFDDCVKELNAIGKNINQITKLCNLEHSVFLDDMEKIQSEMNKIFLRMNTLFRKFEMR